MDNDIPRLLLESLASGGSALNGNAGKLQELISQWRNNPDQIANLLAQYLAKKQEEAQDDSEEEDLDLLLDGTRRENTDFLKMERTRRLRGKFQQMRSELLALRERNDLLADALGACYLCWGEYPGCEECQGRGAPGSRPPNRELFRQFVSPAMPWLQTRNGTRKNDPAKNNFALGNETE